MENKVSIWSLLKYVKEYTFTIVLTLVFLVMSKIASAYDPIWLKKIIDGVSLGSTLQSIIPIIGIYLLLKFIATVFEYFRDLIFSPAEMGIARKLSYELFAHLLNLPISYHHDQKIGGVARKITRGGRAVTFLLDFLVINILPTIAELIIVTYLLLKLYPPIYGVITFVTVITFAIFTIWSTEKRQKYRLGANDADDEVAGVEIDTLQNIEAIKLFNNGESILEKYNPLINKRYHFGVKSNRMFALISSGQGIILIIGMGTIFTLAISQALIRLLTIGDLVLLTTYVVRISMPITSLGFVYRMIKDALADLDGMAKILKEPITIKESAKSIEVKNPKGKVSFENVSFRYANKREVIDNISFTVKPGQKVAFVGPSGVGKSTLVKLLFRLYEPEKGEILIDGIPLDKLSLANRRKIFAIVPQDPALFNTTISENILFAKPSATKVELEKACQLANIDRFIESLPQKYNTLVGERGVKLSGGEKQRIAIARAIIRNPKILVFDEATSSLDSKNEKEILVSLDAISQGRTTIAIAHRLSTIANFDIINVLKKGKIVESGNHKKLMTLKGAYYKLWKIQSHNVSNAQA